MKVCFSMFKNEQIMKWALLNLVSNRLKIKNNKNLSIEENLLIRNMENLWVLRIQWICLKCKMKGQENRTLF